jgi:hypothetical protein
VGDVVDIPSDFKELMNDRLWRLNHLYKIIDERGKSIQLRLKPTQEALFRDLTYRNIILKARQHGFTTYLTILALDYALWNSHFGAGVIAHTKPDAEKIFRFKVKYAYDNLPGPIKAIAPTLVKDTAESLEFSNGSHISVSVSFRSGTLEWLHVSEMGKIAAKAPEKAMEIKTGAFEAVPANGIIVVESTAEGAYGAFKELVDQAQRAQDMGGPHRQLDWRLHFVPWWRDPKYALSDEDVQRTPISQRMQNYFNELLVDHSIILTPNQKAWYVVKESYLGQLMWREYPSHPDEPFKVALDGAYWADQMRRARQEGRICRVPVQPSVPVKTWWDIGRDTTSIWLTQDIGMMVHVVGYMQDSGKGLGHYAKELKAWEKEHDCRLYEPHHYPHDMRVREWGSDRARLTIAAEAGIPGEAMPRMEKKQDGIDAGREFLPLCIFDEEACDTGIAGLDAYRKEWDAAKGVWKDVPLHDAASHPADAFQVLALNHTFSTHTRAGSTARPVVSAGRF